MIHVHRRSWLSFHSHPDLHTTEQGFRNMHKFFTIILRLEKTYKALFFIYGDTPKIFSLVEICHSTGKFQIYRNEMHTIYMEDDDGPTSGTESVLP
jgi:hypothetical protein